MAIRPKASPATRIVDFGSFPSKTPHYRFDGTRSTLSDDVLRGPPERAAVDRGGENLRLRVFVDRSVVEIFVNGRQYLAMRVYPARSDSLGVTLRCRGGGAVLRRLDAWQMTPIRPVTQPGGGARTE